MGAERKKSAVGGSGVGRNIGEGLLKRLLKTFEI